MIDRVEALDLQTLLTISRLIASAPRRGCSATITASHCFSLPFPALIWL